MTRALDASVTLEVERFKEILDAAPIAIVVAELADSGERIVYVNSEFERLTGQMRSDLMGGGWAPVAGALASRPDSRSLGEFVTSGRDYLGPFVIPRGAAPVRVDAWASLIDDGDRPVFRILALVEAVDTGSSIVEQLEERIRRRDTQLLELQHRVKNNLQMITALIRAESKGVTDRSTSEGFDRLAGRVEALGVLYRALSENDYSEGSVDLGVYLTQVASAVMAAHSTNGVTLDLRVDNWPVSIDIAMPLGLVVNELMTNSLKHAFQGRARGTISLHSTCGPSGCRIVVADDGVGLPPDAVWPKPGKLSSLIVRSLLQNAKARSEVKSAPGAGAQVIFEFSPIEAARTAA